MPQEGLGSVRRRPWDPTDLASDLLSAGFAVRLTGGPTVEEWEAKLATYGTD